MFWDRMVNFLSIIALGFFLGMRHATDPDHVIAVSTIVSRQRSTVRSALIGVFWGVGHTVTILLVGAAIILFNVVVPPRVGLSMELCVGLMLIVLGLMNVMSFRRTVSALTLETQQIEDIVHSHPHGHDHGHSTAHRTADRDHHQHAEQIPVAWMDRAFRQAGFYQYVRPLLVGIVHGLAGSAAVALLVLTTIRDPRWGVAYLLVFGVGTIAGMMLITVSLASTFHFVGRSGRFSSGLALAHPHWTPR
jgi:ABC-type nickel/cobalt efflux system permease component RcnA